MKRISILTQAGAARMVQGIISLLPTDGWRSSLRALRHRDFRLYATGHGISLVGTWMQGVAQSWLMYRLTHSESMLGLTLFATHIPVLLLGPLGGLAADRLPRKAVVMAAAAAALLQALAMAVLTFIGRVTETHVLMLAVCLGVINAFDLPGRNTMFMHMVGREDLISAISLNSAMFNFSRVIGPSIAGIAVAMFGEGVCFLLNAASFVPLIVALFRMGPAPPAGKSKGGAAADLLGGFRYAWHTRELLTLLALAGVMNIAYGPVLALGPFFADGIFHKGSTGLGFLVGCIGAGALVGVLELARHKGIAELPSVMLWSACGLALGMAMFAWAPAFWACLLINLFIGFSIVRQNVSGNSLIQSIVPDEYRGRVTALYSMVASGFVPFGSLASGFLAERYGARWVMFGGAMLCLAAAIVYRAHMTGFRRWVQQQEDACAA